MKVKQSKRMKNHTSGLRDKGDRISYGPTELKIAFFENKRECFIGVSKHEKTNESTRPQASPGAFHSNKNSGLKFRKFHVTNGTAFSGWLRVFPF